LTVTSNNHSFWPNVGKNDTLSNGQYGRIRFEQPWVLVAVKSKTIAASATGLIAYGYVHYRAFG